MRHKLLLAVATLVIACLSLPLRATTVSSPSEDQEEAFKKERRIFLWDVTISMVGATRDASFPKGTKRSKPSFDYAKSGFPYYNASKDIFDKTRETLIKLISQVQNESTEIIVLPFRNDIVGEFKANATAAGKEQLCNQIMNWKDLKPGGTYTATCIKKAVSYFTPDRINRLVLLTDGEPSDNEGSKLISFLQNWRGHKETRGNGNYLVYVMLTDEANGEVGNTIIEESKKNPEQITVITPEDDISEMVFISIGHNASIHVRDYFDGKVSTNGKGVIDIPCYIVEGQAIPDNSFFHFTTEENDFVEIDPSAAVRVSEGKLRVPFTLEKSFEENLATLPSDHDMTINISCEKDAACKSIEITGSRAISVSLVMKPEPRVKISWSTK